LDANQGDQIDGDETGAAGADDTGPELK